MTFVQALSASDMYVTYEADGLIKIGKRALAVLK